MEQAVANPGNSTSTNTLKKLRMHLQSMACGLQRSSPEVRYAITG